MIDPEIDFGAMFARFDTILLGRRTYETTRSGAGIESLASRRCLLPDHATTRHLRRRRDAMINALHRELAEAQIHGAAAGLHLMITFDADFTDVDLAAAHSIEASRCSRCPGTARLRSDPGLVLGYAATPVSAIEHGISLLASSYQVLQRTTRPAMIKQPQAAPAGE